MLDDLERERPRVRWRTAVDGPVSHEPALVDDGLFVAGHRELVSLDLDDGRRRWGAQPGGTLGTAPTVVGNLVVVGSRDGSLIAYGEVDGDERFHSP